MKKDHSIKGNLTTKYILHINTKLLELVVSSFAYPDYSVLIHPQNIENQYH